MSGSSGLAGVQDINFWTGVLMTSAVAVLLLPVMAIPFIFGGPRAMQLNIKSHHKPVRKVRHLCCSFRF